MSSPFSVAFVNTHAAIPAALWSACFPRPLEGQWWYDVLERTGLEGQFTFSYALVRQNGQDVGIAPLFLMDVPLDIVLPKALAPLASVLRRIAPSLLRQRTLFVGSPCSDEGSAGVLPGIDRRNALLCLQRALDQEARRLRAPMLVWKDFPSHNADDLRWVAANTGLFSMASFPGTLAKLPGSDKEDFFAAMKGSRRRQLKKKLRTSAALVALDVMATQYPDSSVLDEIFGLFWQTYQHASTKFECLNRRFFELMSALPNAHFLTLREAASGSMVAFMLCIDMGDRVINKYIGLDYARPKNWSLYFRLWEAALDWALGRGASFIQSGQTGYAPKMEMGHKLIALTNYCRHQNPIIHRIYALASKAVDWESIDPALARYEDELHSSG